MHIYIPFFFFLRGIKENKRETMGDGKEEEMGCLDGF